MTTRSTPAATRSVRAPSSWCVPGGLPAGTLTNFQTFVQNAPVSGLPSPGNTFNAYVLHPTGNPLVANEYSIVFDSGPQVVPAMADGVATYPVAGSPAVAAGDVLAFYGQGIPVDLVGSDLVGYPVAAAPTSPFSTDSPPADRWADIFVRRDDPAPRWYGPRRGRDCRRDRRCQRRRSPALTITNPGHDYTAATVAITGAGTAPPRARTSRRPAS